MASNAEPRWDIVPYVAPSPCMNFQELPSGNQNPDEDCTGEGLEAVVQEGMRKEVVITADPVSIELRQNVEEHKDSESVLAKEGVMQGLDLVVRCLEKEMQKPDDPLPTNIPQSVVPWAGTGWQRRLITTKLLGVSQVVFDFIRLRNYPNIYALVMRDAESSVDELENFLGMKDESKFPSPKFLKGWTKETRQRQTGAKDKFYFHSTSKRLFRSTIEVMNYIKDTNNLQEAYLRIKSSNEQQCYIGVRFFEAPSSSSNKKRKDTYHSPAIIPSTPKKPKKKTKQQIELEKFFAEAHRNLMNLKPPTPGPKETERRSTTMNRVEKHNRGSRGIGRKNNVGNYNQNPTRQEMEDWINELSNK